MAFTKHLIDNYRLFHCTASYDLTAVIHCYRGNSYKGTLYFYREGKEITANRKLPSEALLLHFPSHQCAEIIETLRREKPLFLWLDDQLMGGLSTSEEPIGEEELT